LIEKIKKLEEEEELVLFDVETLLLSVAKEEALKFEMYRDLD
jgi:hypothetical protein